MTIPGYHFHPTAEQLISYYLQSKVEGKSFPAVPEIVMEEVEIYGRSEKKEPWELFKDVSIPNKSFYVFTKLEKKSESGKKIKRVAGCGTWDLQNTHEVFGKAEDVIGLKRMFRYEVKEKDEDGRRKKVPRWIMHEYTLIRVPNYALCEIKHLVTDKDMADYLEGGTVTGGRKKKRIRSDDHINLPYEHQRPLLMSDAYSTGAGNGFVGNYEDSDVMIDVEELFAPISTNNDIVTTDPPPCDLDHHYQQQQQQQQQQSSNSYILMPDEEHQSNNCYGSSLSVTNILIPDQQQQSLHHYLPPPLRSPITHDDWIDSATCKNIIRANQAHREQERLSSKS